MRIYAFTQYYPSTFKPYFDTQFAQLVRDGHELTVFAHGRQGGEVNEPVARYGLEARIRRYPTTLHTGLAFLPQAAGRTLLDPGGALRSVRAMDGGKQLNRRLMNTLRMLTLPREQPDLCLVHDLTTAVWFTWLRSLYPGVPVAMYYHGGENALSSSLGDASVLRAFASVDVVFTNTEFSRDHAVARGCPADKVHIVPVGFCLDDYQAAPVRGYRPDGVLRLLSASRLSDEKGHRFALEALAGLVAAGVTDFRYTIVGDGYLREPLERYVAANGLRPYVEFTGMVTTSVLLDHIARADVVLLPSIELGTWVENQACIVQEAMLMKALVVATTAGGVPESTAPELRPFLVPPEDPAAIARAVLAVRALRDDEMRALGEAGRAFAEKRYDIRRLNATLLDRATQAPGRPAVPAAAA
jgi:colanic acid/amylovoran biosynthesis glycosyltransferase